MSLDIITLMCERIAREALVELQKPTLYERLTGKKPSMINEGENLTEQGSPTIDTDFPWRKTIRRETGLVEHICIHGVGHPAYASADYLDQVTEGGYFIHSCDGCCGTEDWQFHDMKEGIRIANSLIITLIDRVSDLMPTNGSE